MESFATPYPVLFYDGEQEHDKGHVGVHSVLTFKRFQALMSQKTGFPANQLSAVFVCRRTQDTEKRQKLPINENTNFNIILNQHNPSRERDCHFLVSMKKSKKERKVTRKRSAETENAEDDDSTSSRGDLSPSDERPKLGNAEETFSPESASPPNFMHRPSSPLVLHGVNTTSPRLGSCSPNGKMSLGIADFKADRTLLRREGMGQNGFASPRSGWASGGLTQRVEGFSASPASGMVDGNVAPNTNFSVVQQEERRKLDKQWMNSSPTPEDGSMRQSEKANGHIPGKPQLQHSSTVELFHQDRFNDAITQGNGIRPPATILARNGGASVGSSPVLQRTNPLPGVSNNVRPLMSTGAAASGGSFIPRVSMGSLATLAGPSGGLTLQQAQAHISHLQQQHQAPLAISQLELSKLNGIFRGLVARDNRGESTKICKFCCFLRERNIGPPPFHWCVDDTITKGFRGPSPAGPIGRPVKRHVEAAA